jgi:Amt family ammonium transporter
MMLSTLLVVMMTVPGLALFYGGLVRSKNMLSILMQVMVVFSLIAVLWAVYGYSLAFGAEGLIIGDLSKMFLLGITPDSLADTFTDNVKIPEYIFIAFQATFAGITCALICGSIAERMKFAAVLLFCVLWFSFAYLPVAHMVWGAGVICSTKARSTLPVARWCTSTRVWRAWWPRMCWASVWAMGKKPLSRIT